MDETGNTGESPTPGQATASGAQPNPSSAQAAPSDVRGGVAQLEALLDEYMVEKSPFTLPMGVKEFIVKVSPYLVIIMAVAVVPLILVGLGLSAILTPIAMLGGAGFSLFAFIAALVSLVALVMEIMAVPGLFKRTHKAWKLVFYASIAGLLGNILMFHIVDGLFGAIIGWYVLFQVKELYKN